VRVADLPWYDFSELEDATDAWWRGMAAHLRAAGIDAVPEGLRREVPYADNWRDPRLLLSQACGYDVLYDSADDLVPLATPRYAAAGCVGPRYRSAVVVRAGEQAGSMTDLRGRTLAVNDVTSHSGLNALRPLAAPHGRDGGFFGRVLLSGSHPNSMALVQNGDADVACIDVVVLELARRVRPEVCIGLRILADSEPALAPPYVTSAATDAATRARIRQALAAAAADPRLAACRSELLLEGFEFVEAEAYGELAAFEASSLAAGYHELPAPRRSPLWTPHATVHRAGTCGCLHAAG
jgi:ABC-type phosphate/phosphonate transport system substrate-binding protein